jgi:hypothetical protein
MDKTRVVHKREPHDVYIGRPSKWGNPYSHLPADKRSAPYGASSREASIQAYDIWIHQPEQAKLLASVKTELKGKVLACWCKPLSCHGDILARIADEE